jgi:hypothetical protein
MRWFYEDIVLCCLFWFLTLHYLFSDCSSSAAPTDLCQNVSALIKLNLVNEDPHQVVPMFESALTAAIAQGRLQDDLNQINPNTPVQILTGQQAAASNGHLSNGGIAGIVIGCVAILLLPTALYLTRQRRKNDAAQIEKSQTAEVTRDENNSVKDISMEDIAPPVLGATAPDYGGSHQEFQAMAAGEDVMAEPEADGASAESSNAGDSGWSSSAGVSSLNTGSVDDSMDAALAAGAVAGGGSALASRGNQLAAAGDASVTYVCWSIWSPFTVEVVYNLRNRSLLSFLQPQ